jgi:hypothetical protein
VLVKWNSVGIIVHHLLQVDCFCAVNLVFDIYSNAGKETDDGVVYCTALAGLIMDLYGTSYNTSSQAKRCEVYMWPCYTSCIKSFVIVLCIMISG